MRAGGSGSSWGTGAGTPLRTVATASHVEARGGASRWPGIEGLGYGQVVSRLDPTRPGRSSGPAARDVRQLCRRAAAAHAVGTR